MADQQWLFAGTDTRPTRGAYEADLVRLRALPDQLGVDAFCRDVLGFDHFAVRRDLLGEITPPVS